MAVFSVSRPEFIHYRNSKIKTCDNFVCILDMKHGLSPNEKNRWKMYQYRVKRRIFGYNREEKTGNREECTVG
jgi:hypothetical protein